MCKFVDLKMTVATSRILDIPCKVCGDFSSGKHYNIFACDGCAGFFKRSIRRNRRYICKGKEEGSCVIDKAHRNQCRACRLHKCQEAGMNKDAVQHERGPRNATMRKAVTTYFEHHQRAILAFGGNPSVLQPMVSPNGSGVLDLALPKSTISPPTHMEAPMIAAGPMIPPAPYVYLPRISMMPTFQAPSMISPPVTPPPTLVTLEDVWESAAQLLFLNIQWTKSLPYFAGLPVSDQLLLLEEGWKDLFILGAAQFFPSIDLMSMVEGSEAFKKENRFSLIQRVQEFQEIFLYVKQLHLDTQEFFYLRVMSLFKAASPGNLNVNGTSALVEVRSVIAVANDAQMSLNKYDVATRPQDPLRFGKHFFLLNRIRAIPAEATANIFFQKAVGQVPMIKVIADMYRKQQS